jgi:flagellar basal-body rod protein FlgF
MEKLAFNAVAAINEQRLTRQVLAHEMANVNTTGFKKSFESSLKAFKADGQGFDTNYQPQVVHSDQIQLTPGPQMVTGRDLDISMNNSTVMGVTAPNGELAFTRRGDLRVNVNGVLETSTGAVVKAEGGGQISVPQGFKVNIGDDGSVFAVDPAQPGVQQPVQIGQILLRDAANTPLNRRQDGLFQVQGQTVGSDIASGRGQSSITVGSLEASNVNPMETMVRLIEQSRTFEQQVKVVKEVQSTDESGATMMKLAS